MKALKLIAVLLDYPGDTLWQHREELLAAAADAGQEPKCREGHGWPGATAALPAARRRQLADFVTALFDLDPMQAQERWLGMFDRGRSMSLLLFEHIHGESRDRGQAMVDLIETYRSNGFEMASKELPDYLPLVLEYLSQRPGEEIRDWLHHTGHILELLAARAAERESPYALLFELLVEIGQGKVDLGPMRQRVASEPRDDTAEAMDLVWEEEAVRFGNDAPEENCAPPRRLPAGSSRPSVASAALGLLPGGSARPSVASAALGLLPGGSARPSVASAALELLPGGSARPSVASAALGLLPGGVQSVEPKVMP